MSEGRQNEAASSGRPGGRGHRALERFSDELLNPPGGDAGLVVTLEGLSRVLLFDLGDNRLPGSVFTRVSDLFVTHTHIDHFIGFDRLLRSLLGRTRTVRVWGPRGIAAAVTGKLAGYTWNLDFDEVVRFLVHEVLPGRVVVTELSLADGFRRARPKGRLPLDEPSPGAGRPGLLLDESGFRVLFGRLDHGTESLGFALEQREGFRFDVELLARRGIAPGPALGELKRDILAGRVPRGEAEGLGRWIPPRRICYVTDFGFTEGNVRTALALARGAERLYVEATFPDREADKAARVHHLTGGQAGALARAAMVTRVVPFHFSRKYSAGPGEILRDLELAWTGERGRWLEEIRAWVGEDLTPLAVRELRAGPSSSR